MIKSFFDKRGEKRRLSGAKARLFNEVYRKMTKSDGKFIFVAFLRWIIVLILLLSNLILFGSSTFHFSNDSVKSIQFLEPVNHLNKSRLYSTSGIWAACYGSSLYLLSNYWYEDLQGFRTFNDSKNWLQVDKMGHLHTAYFQGAWGAQLMQWAGLKHKPATLVGGSIGFVNQAIIEVLDGRSPSYGWSHSDFLANALGSAMFISQELTWKEQRLLLKFGYTKQNYSKFKHPLIKEVAFNEYGKGAEAFFKDYNGQTYWLSANFRSMFPQLTGCPKWLNAAVGFGADQMFHAVDNRDNHIHNFNRRREFYLSLDVDLTKIETNNRLLKTALFLLNIFKVPCPGIRINTDGEWHMLPLSF